MGAWAARRSVRWPLPHTIERHGAALGGSEVAERLVGSVNSVKWIQASIASAASSPHRVEVEQVERSSYGIGGGRAG